MKLFLTLILSITIISCQTKKSKTVLSEPITSVEIIKQTYSFGVIKSSDSVEYKYQIKNIGKVPLIIQDVETTCGCTIPDWSKEPIQPNEYGTIDVKFKPNQNTTGSVKKAITFQANTDSIFHFLYITGEIIN